MSVGRRLAYAIVLAISATASAADKAAEAERDSVVQGMMRDAGLPGVQTVVVKNGKVVWSRSYGQAVLDPPGRPQPMRDDTFMFA